MRSGPHRCPYVFQDSFERIECEHPVYKDHGFCVFHSERVAEKANDFYKAFAKWVVACSRELDFVDLRGFVVPEIKLEDIVFEKRVDFRGARFSDNVLFVKVTFAGGADFSHSQFEKQRMEVCL